MLDGDSRRPADMDVIAVLRAAGGSATSQELERRLGVGRRDLLRVVARPRGVGRVRRDVSGMEGVIGTEPRWALVEPGYKRAGDESSNSLGDGEFLDRVTATRPASRVPAIEWWRGTAGAPGC